ncbi:predicted protein [Nematostella vectensis]|uniref:DUF4371 domain-containing protein n=1 Tax=Nematostella vectensis TaxID=45351 RepID=A7SVN2_NEMVE|nr:predicted protein [Nematostella vectensis]|eukprot:XP_001624336.1 predicted protein [Nematostella vectensis]
MRNRNARYTSPRIQNEIIEINSNDMILDGILDKIRAAKFFSIMADEVTSKQQGTASFVYPFRRRHSSARRIYRFHPLTENNRPRNSQCHIGKAAESRSGPEKYPCCHQQSIRNAIDKLKQCSLFFLGSPKRKANSKLVDEECQLASWDRRSKDDAAFSLASLTSFDFIVPFLVLYEFLSHLAGITVKLQGRAVDIVKAYQEILQVKETYEVLSLKMDKTFSNIYTHAVRIADIANTDPSIPRLVGALYA